MFTRFLAAACGLAVVLTSTFCYGVEGEPRIGYISSGFVDDFQVSLAEAAEQAAGKRGLSLAVADARGDVDEQVRLVKHFIDKGGDALIVVPVDAARVEPMIKIAKEAEMPLVFVNRNPFVGMRPPSGCHFVGTDAFAEGEAMVRLAGGLIGPTGNVLMLQGRLPSGPAESRTEGIRHALSTMYPEMGLLSEVSADWNRDIAREVVERWIAAFGRGRMDAILAQNDAMALGALDALEAAGVEGVVVVGVDAIPQAVRAVRDGRLAGTVIQDPALQGSGAINLVVDVLNGRVGELSVIYPSVVIDMDTLEKSLQVAQ